jgi:cytoskeleton protein RodZ
MNEPLPPADVEAPREPDPARDGAATEPAAQAGIEALTEVEAPAEGSFGDALRAAREAAGISVSTLATRLRLHVKQIDALERADLAALPNLIYVRGFVRSCARELKVDPLPLLADLDRRAGVIAGAPLAPAGGNFPLARLGDGSRPIVAIAIVVLVIAGIVGTLWPRRPAAPPPPVETVAAPALPDPAPAAAPTVPEAAPVPAPAEAASGATAGSAAHAPAAAGKAPTGKTDPAHAADAPAPAPAAPEAAPAVAAVPEAAPPDANGLVLHVHAPSWVEVVQANGTSVFSQICPAGSVQTIHGAAPLRVVVGNAAAVDAQYHGAPVDLNRYANVNGVARFTLQ